MTDRRQTLGDVASQIVRMYRTLGGDKVIDEIIRRRNLLGRRIAFLSDLSKGDIGPEDLNDTDGLSLQESLLDAIALQVATGDRASVFSTIGTSNPSWVGKSRLRRAKLLGSDDEQLDWHFQTLVQAWAVNHSSNRIKELESDLRLKGSRSCDFAIERSKNRLELLECKRFRPEHTPQTGSIDALIGKLRSRVPDAADQLKVTAKVLGATQCDTHLLIDITAYSDLVAASSSVGEATEFGGFPDETISGLRAELTTLGVGIDKVTLCWHAPVKIAGRFRAIVQRVTTVVDSKPVKMLDYSGWTVEAYPLGSEYREFRVSAVARSVEGILTSFRNLSSPETFFTTGPSEDTPL